MICCKGQISDNLLELEKLVNKNGGLFMPNFNKIKCIDGKLVVFLLRAYCLVECFYWGCGTQIVIGKGENKKWMHLNQGFKYCLN